jgi:hypothetical protein
MTLAGLKRALWQNLLVLAQHLAQGTPVDQLHHDERGRRTRRVVLLARVVDGHDRGMAKPAGCKSLPPEPRPEKGIDGQVGAQALDRYRA